MEEKEEVMIRGPHNLLQPMTGRPMGAASDYRGKASPDQSCRTQHMPATQLSSVKRRFAPHAAAKQVLRQGDKNE